MPKVILLFCSMSGNTEEMAEIIESNITNHGLDVHKFQIDMDDMMATDLLDYDAILFGTYTWGDGDIPYEVEDFYDDMEEIDLTGKVVALFGSCDSMYPNYGGAIETFSERFKERGASNVLYHLKVDLTPDQDDVKRCRKFAEEFVEQLHTYA
ncbi:flavodoxin [Gracilibacillus caseinilyticus]|uniref:Flavodoxin n=1 Tax=Gracilibacillus caseinilyticus TaxID=2932256 RepID=A0ABY4F5C8_9BACI|nr:flavodoxin [Gracilibacillus caseinilyticus]UOQ49661.1 flavodoxin [Gracilibacillus caseinilyticus]